MKPKSSIAGFTLIEMMVVAGVISVLAVGFSAYMYQQTRGLAEGQKRENLNQLQMNVLAASGKPDQILQTEALQVQVWPSNGIECGVPCVVLTVAGAPTCVYDCSNAAHSHTCPALPAGCSYLNEHSCCH